MSKLIHVTMSSNAETFNFAEAVHWKRATLERCNFVAENGGSAAETYVLHIDQIPQEMLFCDGGACTQRIGTFLVGSEPFNPQETQTVANRNPSLPLENLSLKVYKNTGALATVSSTFTLRLRIDN